MIAIIDYGAGNLRSIQRAFDTIGVPATITTEPATIAEADAIVFPGVGHAGAAMRRLHELGLPDSIRQAVATGKPFLGVCLGMQLLFGHQDEGDAEGLGLLAGRVRALSGPIKVPHIGWNQSRLIRDSPLGPTGEETYYYFVHSYIVEPEDPADVAAAAGYGGTFPSIVIRDNVWGTQFHPEKSGTAGLRLLQAFTAQIPANHPQAIASGAGDLGEEAPVIPSRSEESLVRGGDEERGEIAHVIRNGREATRQYRDPVKANL